MNFAWRCKVELFKQRRFDIIPLAVDKNVAKKSEKGCYYFSPKQVKALEYLTDNSIDSVAYGGGAFSGKTLLECYWLLLSCCAYPGTAWGLGRDTVSNLNKTTLVTMFKILRAEGFVSEKDYKYRGSSVNTIEFENESVIYLVHMAYKPSDPLYARFGGFELTGAAVDESAECKYQGIGILITRLGRRKNEDYNLVGKLLETFNPDKGHVNRRHYLPFKKGEEKESSRFIMALPSDNPHPSVKPWIEKTIREGHKETIERLIYGNFDFDDDPLLLVSNEAVNDMWSNSFVREGDSHIVCDASGKGRDDTIIKVYKGLVVVDFHKEKISDEYSIKANIIKLQRKWNCPNRRTIVDADGIGGKVVDIMPGVIRFNANKSPADTFEAGNFATFKDQCGFLLAHMINNNMIYYKIDAERDKTVEEYAVLKEIETANKPKKLMPKKGNQTTPGMKEILGRSPDRMDCDLMRMYFELKPKRDATKWV